MDREQALSSLQSGSFDVLIIGGGATGLGIAVDAATRGYRTALVEAGDFAQATSSRATKLAHGGVRYLANGHIHLVYEALHERATMLRNAPHLVHPLPFVLPAYRYHELPYYGTGLFLYNLLSGGATLGPTRLLNRRAILKKIPGIAQPHLTGGVLYHDGQFNDARFALALARTAMDHGATVLNYVRCARFLYHAEKLSGAVVTDVESGADVTVHAKTVINATGIFADNIRRMDDPAAPKLLSISRGTHIVVSSKVLGGNHAVIMPKTSDGRVIFAIPWQGKVIIGTTDVPASEAEMEPGHTQAECAYLIEHVNRYLQTPIRACDILSIFSGLRPLLAGRRALTSQLSREHHIEMSLKGLITIAGGKWTTYRRMAEDTLNFAIHRNMLPPSPCVTSSLAIRGAKPRCENSDLHLREYGSDLPQIRTLIAGEPALAQPIHPRLPYCMALVVYAVRSEMARTLEDVLARRTRSLLLDARATLEAAPTVASRIATELQRNDLWIKDQLAYFSQLARSNYLACENAL